MDRGEGYSRPTEVRARVRGSSGQGEGGMWDSVTRGLMILWSGTAKGISQKTHLHTGDVEASERVPIQEQGAEGGVVQPRTRSTGEITKPTTRRHSMT